VEQIHRENGFEIRAAKDQLLLIDRRTWGLGYAMAVLCSLAGLLALLGLLMIWGVTELRPGMPAVAPFGASGALLFPISLIWRTYRERRDLRLEEVRDVLTIDRPSGVLRTRRGDILANWTPSTLQCASIGGPGA